MKTLRLRNIKIAALAINLLLFIMNSHLHGQVQVNCPQNLILNGDFEAGVANFGSGLINWPVPFNAIPYNYGYYDVTGNASLANAGFTGLPNGGAGFLVADGAAVGCPVSVWNQNVNLVAGQPYVFSFFLLSLTGQGDAGLMNVTIGGIVQPSAPTPISSTNAWTQYTVNFTPAVTGPFLFSINQVACGWLGFDYGLDDISLIQTHTFTININTTPACDNICNGTATVTVTGAPVNPVTYLWSNGATTTTITGLCIGTYTVTVTDNSGCSGSASATVSGCCNVPPCDMIANGSFEEFDGSACPNISGAYLGGGVFDGVNYDGFLNCWNYPTWGSPDYFTTTCGSTGGPKVPWDGNSYVGFLAYSFDNGTTSNSYREYIETPLSEPCKSCDYRVMFRASVADDAMFGVPLQVQFNPTFTGNPIAWCLPATPANTVSTAIVATNGNTAADWQLMQAVYTATGGEQFIIIGNFVDNVNTPTTNIGGNSIHTYMYVDFVSIEHIDIDESITNSCATASCGAIDLTISCGTAPYAVQWSNGETTEDISGLVPGVYTVTVTDASGLQCIIPYTVADLGPCFTITKTATPRCTYAGAPVDYAITICNFTCEEETLTVQDIIPPDFTTNNNPFPSPGVDVPIPVGCTTWHMYGYFSTVGDCDEPMHINTVILDLGNGTLLTDTECVCVMMGCPFAFHGRGGCNVDDEVLLSLTGHTPVTGVNRMRLRMVYPDFLDPQTGTGTFESIEIGQPHSEIDWIDPPPPVTLPLSIPVEQTWGSTPVNYQYIEMDVFFTPTIDISMNPFWYQWVLVVKFKIASAPPPGVSVFPCFVDGPVSGLYRTDIYDIFGQEIFTGGAWTAANYILLEDCPTVTPLDASFTISQIPCDPHGGVTVTANYNAPGIIHNWTWGDNRTTPINGAVTFTYNYYDPICDNTGYNFCNPPYNLPPIPPALPGTYTITHTVIDLTTGASTVSTQQVVLYPACCQQPVTIHDQQLSSSIGSSLSSVSVAIEGEFIIDQPFTFNSCQVTMEPGSKITVQAPNTFQIDNSTLEACSNMWKGIFIENGATCITNSSIIKDAQYAFDAVDGATIGLYGSTFDRNYVTIHVPDNPNPPYFNTVLHVIDGCTFDCSSSLHAPFTGQTPAPGSRSYAGVDAHGVSLDFSGLGSNQNHFKNLSNGIVGAQSNFTIANCDFKQIQPDASYNTNGFNGSGIYLTGGHGFFTLDQTGYGSAGASSFDRCYRGIYTNGVNVRSSDNRMTDMDYGYRIDYGSNMSIDVLNNYIRSYFYGIDLRMNDNAAHLLVYGNEIHFGLAGPAKGISGINVMEQNGTNTDSKINLNRIWHVPGATNAFIGIEMTSASNYEVTHNEVYLDNNKLNKKGIATKSCLKDEVSCNRITGPGTDYDLVQKDQSAIMVVMGDYHSVSCNFVEGTANGILFSGYAYNTDVKGNDINYHKYGLHLDNSAIIGTQKWKGNKWYSAAASGGFGAWYENLFNANNFKFLYDPLSSPGAIVQPPSWDPPVWFSNLAHKNFECSPRDRPDFCSKFEVIPCADCDKEIDEEIAQQRIQNGEFTIQSQYELGKKLWEKLDKNQAYRKSSPLLESFYKENQNGLLEQVNEVSASVSNLHGIEPKASLELQKNKSQLLELVKLLKTHVAILHDDKSTAGQKSTSAAAITGVKSNIQVLMAGNNAAIDRLAASKDLTADQIKAANAGVNAIETVEINDRDVTEIYLSTIARGITTFDQSQSAILLSIAQQCPLAGGNSVYKARSLYSLIDDAVSFNDVKSCQNTVKGNYHASDQKTASDNKSATYPVSIHPNPVTDKATLTYAMPDESNGLLVLTDVYGKEILKYVLDSKSTTFTFNTMQLNQSVYFYRVYSDNRLIGSGKFSKIK